MKQTENLGNCKTCGYNLDSEDLKNRVVNYCPICGSKVEMEPERIAIMEEKAVKKVETKAEYLSRMLESMAKCEEQKGHSNMLPMLRPESVLREAARTLLELEREIQETEKAPDSGANTEQEHI